MLLEEGGTKSVPVSLPTLWQFANNTPGWPDFKIFYDQAMTDAKHSTELAANKTFFEHLLIAKEVCDGNVSSTVVGGVKIFFLQEIAKEEAKEANDERIKKKKEMEEAQRDAKDQTEQDNNFAESQEGARAIAAYAESIAYVIENKELLRNPKTMLLRICQLCWDLQWTIVIKDGPKGYLERPC